MIVKTTVYGDVLFIINFSMDILSMYISGKILHLQIKKKTLIPSCIIGGIYGVLSLFIKSTLLSVFLNIAVYLLMCFIAYPKINPRQYIKLCCIFWSVSLLSGGAVTWFYTFIDRFASGALSPSSPARKMPLSLFLIIAFLCAISAYITGRIFSKNANIKDVYLSVFFKENKTTLHVLVDSGNLLQEPLSGLPVILVTNEKFKNITGTSSDLILQNEELFSKIRIIPASSAGGNVTLYGIVADEILVETKRGAFPYKAVVAVCKTRSYADFDGVCPLSIYE